MRQNEPPREQMRLDKWLKVARIFKTRSRAAEACDQRHVKVNGQTAKPAKTVRIGDEITVRFGNRFRTLEIKKVTLKSLPAALAAELYSEQKVDLSDESLELMEVMKRLDRKLRPKYKGRPTKKERRQIEKLKGF